MDHDHFLAGSLDDHFFWPLSPEPFHDLINAVSEAAVPPPAPAGPPPPTVWRSAFSAYTRPPPQEEQQQRGRQNVHRRMMELLRWVHRGKQEGRACGGGRGPGWSSREFRHMMRERQRRERLSQSYADLHHVLSPRTKADKNSVVQSAATMLRDLKGVKERLQRRNEELVSSIRPVAGATPPERAPAGDKTDQFEVRVESQDSSIDSMISALRCLQGTGVKTKAIQLKIAGGGGGGGLIVVVTTERDERNSASKVKGMLEKMLTVK